DGYPDYHQQGCREVAGLASEPIARDQAVEDGFAECAVCRPEDPDAAAPDAVWVVDGFPDYHRENCPTLVGLPAQAVAHDQATEDGFAECGVCRPEADEAPDLTPATSVPDASAPAADDTVNDVWVVDGFPDYHRE